MTGTRLAERAYGLCLQAYPHSYQAEHGPEILATLADLQGAGAFSPREASALLFGGFRQRAGEAHAGGSAQAGLSALRGSLVAVSVFTLLNLLFALPAAFWEAGVLQPAGWTGAPSLVRVMVATGVLAGVLVGSATLAAGRRRVAGLAVLGAAVLTSVSVHAAGGPVMNAGMLAAGGLVVLGSSRRSTAGRRRHAVAGAGIAATVSAILVANVAVAPLTWMSLHQSWLAAGAVGMGMVLAPLDGRLALGAAAAAAVEQAWTGGLGTELKSLGLHTLLSQADAAAVLVLALAGALWGCFWVLRRGGDRHLASAA
jgi:hypothetical protein